MKNFSRLLLVPLFPSLRIVAALLACLLPTGPAAAWWEGGHKVIAYLAHEELTPAERSWVMSLLEANPTRRELFEEKFEAEFPTPPDEATRQLWFFGQASVWADRVRYSYGYSNASAIKAAFDRPERHYTDLPIFTSEAARHAFKEHDLTPVTAWDPSQKEPETKLNSMQAFAKIETHVPDASIPAAERAVELLWLFHLVGDTHQPCHCAQLFDPEKFPQGDRGANGVMILGLRQKSPATMTSDVLHAFWDSLFDGKNGNTHRDIVEHCGKLKANVSLYSAARAASAVINPLAWLREGKELAAASVYSPELLQRIAAGRVEIVEKKSRSLGTRLEHTVMVTMAPEALDAYAARARVIADQQAVTAALRLAASLKRLHAAAVAGESASQPVP